MLESPGSCDETSGGILYHLHPLQKLVADADKYTVAGVQPSSDEGLYKCVYRLRRQRLSNEPELSQVEEAGSAEP